jgi:hypothetical protein
MAKTPGGVLHTSYLGRRTGEALGAVNEQYRLTHQEYCPFREAKSSDFRLIASLQILAATHVADRW